MTRGAMCWVGDCDADLEAVNGWWRCPKGCQLRDVSPWVLDHIRLMSAAPDRIPRYFGDLA